TPSYTLSLHDALPIYRNRRALALRVTLKMLREMPHTRESRTTRTRTRRNHPRVLNRTPQTRRLVGYVTGIANHRRREDSHNRCRSEEHTSELQSRENL